MCRNNGEGTEREPRGKYKTGMNGSRRIESTDVTRVEGEKKVIRAKAPGKHLLNA